MLSQDDEAALERRGLTYEVAARAGWTELIIRAFALPSGFEPQATDLLLRLPPGFPDAAPDMWWVHPHVTVSATGRPPAATEVHEIQADGRTWQRFSRHLQTPWRPGIDDLDTWLNLIERSLAKDVA